jgi:diacylglycerol kinase family enzyme
MYYYIFDQGNLPADKYEALQTQTTGLLAEFKIAGETGRVTPLRSIADLIDTASQRGAKTLIACGSDDTFNQMLVALKGRDFVLGFIPFDPQSFLAKILGLDSVFTRVKTIAGRRIEKIDLAKIADNYFLSFLEFGVMSKDIKTAGFFSGLKLLSGEVKNIQIKIDNAYVLKLEALGGMLINARATTSKNRAIANPTDSHLDLLILEKLSKTEILRYRHLIAQGFLEQVPKTTVIKCRKVEFLEPRGMNLTILGRIVAKLPSTVEIIPQRLRLIVGKNRTF